MTSVSRFEADILRVIHAAFGRGSVDLAVKILSTARPRPKCLGRPALDLIEETLARGCVRTLASRDNWRRESFLRGDRVARGRLWEREVPESLGLAFSRYSLEFLIHLVNAQPADLLRDRWPAVHNPSTGDSLLVFFVFEAFRKTSVGEVFRKLPMFWSEPLCRLAFPADFAEAAEAGELDLTTCLVPSRIWILEALQATMAEAWVSGELSKRNMPEPAKVVAIAREQRRVMDGFCSAVDAIGRRDLARFLLQACRELLRLGTGLDAWTGGLNFQGLRLADRAEATRAALAVLEVLERLEGWEHEARVVGYFDEGYASAQLWKSDWERFGGEASRSQARSLFRAADPMTSAS